MSTSITPRNRSNVAEASVLSVYSQAGKPWHRHLLWWSRDVSCLLQAFPHEVCWRLGEHKEASRRIVENER